MAEFKYVESRAEVLKLFPLFHKFFEKATPDYTEKEFFRQLEWVIDNGVIAYIEEDGVPLAYGIMVKAHLFHDVALLLQVYSERPGLLETMMQEAEKVTRSLGCEKMTAIVDFRTASYLNKKYGFSFTQAIIERTLPPEEKEEVG